ncbi:MAG: glutathione S-transferase N-terminal domain-containing protein [Candidatus Omnitrophica bacterium]|nr:glutathione S-transferase N-terminal domain-containing protein [Candidatus Omnitrophota bacterium]
MAKVKIYTTQYCPFCSRVKSLFKSKGIEVEEIDVTYDPEMRQKLSDQTGWMTVPMVFIGDQFIGGYDDARSLDEQGKLDPLISG